MSEQASKTAETSRRRRQTVSGISAYEWARPIAPLFLAAAGLFVVGIVALCFGVASAFVAAFSGFGLCIVGATVLAVVGGRRAHLEAAYGYSTILRSAEKIDVVDWKTGVVIRSADEPALPTRAQANAAVRAARAIGNIDALPIDELPAVQAERMSVVSGDTRRAIRAMSVDGAVAQALYDSRAASTNYYPAANSERFWVVFDTSGVAFIGARKLVWARFSWAAVGKFYLGSADLQGRGGPTRTQAFAIPLPGGTAEAVPTRKVLGLLPFPMWGDRIEQLIAEVEKLRPA